MVLCAATHESRGQAVAAGDGGQAILARLMAPAEVEIDKDGNIFVTERTGYRVRRIDARTGSISTVAGTGQKGFSGDGGPATAAQFDQVSGLALDSAGNLYVGDLWNSRIRRVDARSGIVTTVVGTGRSGFSGDGGPALDAQISAPFDIVVARDGDILFTDTENHRIRRVDAATGIITTIAGDGRWGFRGDGGPATGASFARPHCLMFTPDDDLYVCDSFNHRIRRIDGGTGRINTVVGIGLFGSAGDGGQAARAAITYVGDFALDSAGNLLFSDIATHRIRRVDRNTGVIVTVAGNAVAGYAGDGGPALNARFDLPIGIEFDAEQNLVIVDSWNGRIRRMAARTGVVATIAGSQATPETPDWRFRISYDPAATRAANNRAPAVRHADASRVRMIDIAFPRRDALPGVLSLYLPPAPQGSGTPRTPLVVVSHGRSNQEVRPRESGGMAGWARLLAASGFAVVVPDHRLGNGGSAVYALEDVRAALETVRARTIPDDIDFNRICFLSFGEGVAPVVPLLSEYRPNTRCLVAFYPVVDLSDDRHFLWTTDREHRSSMSLLASLTNGSGTVPTFIARGGADRSEVNEGIDRLYQLATARNLPVTLVTHPTGQAGFERSLADDDAARVVRQAIQFIRQMTIRNR